MELKDIQERLKELRDRIRAEGRISPKAEEELRNLLNSTLITANDELSAIQGKIQYSMIKRAGNDNVLTPEQKRRLSIIEKTGTGSQAVH